ncbi:phage tail tape measure protein [Corynebacterium ulcerans]|uniref:phage tail tape measure protein n=1 Tax=Corynebacterium ulcerans TaxID=65058 RepID=UPI000C789BE3|nr:phage tail tape measure protein [Corynebacterium ulcerans]PLW01194.1 phage tail tape measure protein [Corynebacterium ulcerans]
MSAVAHASMPISPSLRGLRRQLESEINAPLTKISKQAGETLKKGIGSGVDEANKSLKAAQSYHEKASKDAIKLEKEVEAAKEAVVLKTQSVQLAEESLVATRSRGVADAKKQEAEIQKLKDSGKASVEQIAAAEEKLKAIRDDATAKATAKEVKLQEAKNKQRDATEAVEKKEKDLARARDKVAEATENIASRTKRLEKAQEEAAKSTGAMSRGMEKFKEKGSHAIGTISEKLKGLPGLMLGATAGIAGIASIKGAVWDVGKEFESTYNIIRSGTGASGEAFEDLKQSLKNVSGTVSAEGGLAELGTTMADLNTRLGLSGAPLEEMTRQFQNLKHLGFDADVTAVSSALSAFGLEAEQMPEAMNDLFRISQATGVSIDGLANSAVKGAPQLKQFGFDLGESAALIGKLDKAGLEADATVGSLSKAMVSFAKAGKDPQEELFKTARAVEELLDKGDDAAAVALAEKLFGTKGAGKFVEAVKTEALSIDDLQGNIGVTTDTINGLAAELETTGQKWQRFKDNAKEALEPISTAVQDFAKNKLESLIQFIPVVESFFKEKLVPAVKALPEAFQEVGRWIEDNKEKLILFASAVAPVVLPLIVGLGVTWIQSGVKSLIGAAKNKKAWAIAKADAIKGSAANVKAIWKLGWAWTKSAGKAVLSAGKIAGSWIIAMGPVGAIIGVIAGLGLALWAFFTKTETGQKIWQGFTDLIKNGAEWIKEAFGKIISGAKELFDAFINSDFVAGVKALFDGIVTLATNWWEQLKANFAAGFEIVKTVFTTGWEVVKDIFATAWLVIVALFTGKWGEIGGILAAGWESIKARFSEAIDHIKAVVGEWLEGTKERISSSWDTVTDLTKRLGSAIKNFFTDMVESVKAKVSEWASSVGNKATEMKDNLIEIVKGIPGKIKDFFKDAGKWLKDAGKNIISGLLDGLKEKWQSVSQWFKDAGDSISGFFGSANDSASSRIRARNYRDGGHLPGYKTGGVLPDIPGISRSVRDPIVGITSAGVPIARVEPGEFVVNRQATAAHLPLLRAINGGAFKGRGDMGLPRYQNGGVVSPDELLRFAAGQRVQGQQASRSLEAAKYIFGGSNWGDCSSTQGQLALFSAGKPATNGRYMSTMDAASKLPALGFRRGQSPGRNAFEIGVLHGGPGGGHTSGTVFGPDGKSINLEMGGGRGNGQIAGNAAGARHSQYTDRFYTLLKGAPAEAKVVSTSVEGATLADSSGNSFKEASFGAAQSLFDAAKKSLGLYDNGGWIPNGGLAVNLSGKPERVLSAPEFGGLDKIGTALLQLVPMWRKVAAESMKPVGAALSGVLSNTAIVADAEKGLAETRKGIAGQAKAIADAEKEYAEAKKELAQADGEKAKSAAEKAKKAEEKIWQIREQSKEQALLLEAAERAVVAARITAVGEAVQKFFNGVTEQIKHFTDFFGEAVRFAEQVAKTREEIGKLHQQQVTLRIAGVKAANDLRVAEWDVSRVRMQGLIDVAKAEDELARVQRGHLTLASAGVDGLAKSVDRFRITGALSMEALGAAFVANAREVEAAEWALQAARAKANLDNFDAEHAASLARLQVAEATLAQAQAADTLRLTTMKLQDETQRLYGMNSNQAKGAQGFLSGLGGVFGGIAKIVGGLAVGAASLATGNILGAVTAGAGAIGGIRDIVGGVGAAKANHADFKEAWKNSTTGARAGLGLGIAGGVLGGVVGAAGAAATGDAKWVESGSQLGGAFTGSTLGAMMDFQKHHQDAIERRHQFDSQQLQAKYAVDSARLAAERAVLEAKHSVGKQALNAEITVADLNRQRAAAEEGTRQRSALVEAAKEAARARDSLVAEARRTNEVLGPNSPKQVINIDLSGEPADSKVMRLVRELQEQLDQVKFNIKNDDTENDAQRYSRVRQGLPV